jgi:hypothetical protein
MIHDREPGVWKNVEWWLCPSYYTPDPLLARTFGAFEPDFLHTLAEHLPAHVACFWTGPSVVSKKIGLAHVREIAKQLKHKLILWDNYPVNDLSMKDELHIGPLQGRDSRLPQAVYGYLNNPLLQQELGLIPLATCFDYADNPSAYDPEASWVKIIREHFGSKNLAHWRIIRDFCEALQRCKTSQRPLRWSGKQRRCLKAAYDYIQDNQRQNWAREIRPWRDLMQKVLD